MERVIRNVVAYCPLASRSVYGSPVSGSSSASRGRGSCRGAFPWRQGFRLGWAVGSAQEADVGFSSLRELIVLRRDVIAVRMRSRSVGRDIQCSASARADGGGLIQNGETLEPAGSTSTQFCNRRTNASITMTSLAP